MMLAQYRTYYSYDGITLISEPPPSIYCSIATRKHGGVTEISLKGSEVSRVTVGVGRFGGVAFDSARKAGYWSNGYRINRANRSEGAKEDWVTRSFNSEFSFLKISSHFF